MEVLAGSLCGTEDIWMDNVSFIKIYSLAVNQFYYWPRTGSVHIFNLWITHILPQSVRCQCQRKNIWTLTSITRYKNMPGGNIQKNRPTCWPTEFFTKYLIEKMATGRWSTAWWDAINRRKYDCLFHVQLTNGPLQPSFIWKFRYFDSNRTVARWLVSLPYQLV